MELYSFEKFLEERNIIEDELQKIVADHLQVNAKNIQMNLKNVEVILVKLFTSLEKELELTNTVSKESFKEYEKTMYTSGIILSSGKETLEILKDFKKKYQLEEVSQLNEALKSLILTTEIYTVMKDIFKEELH